MRVCYICKKVINEGKGYYLGHGFYRHKKCSPHGTSTKTEKEAILEIQTAKHQVVQKEKRVSLNASLYKNKKKIEIIKELYSKGCNSNEIIETLATLFDTPRIKLESYVKTLIYRIKHKKI